MVKPKIIIEKLHQSNLNMARDLKLLSLANKLQQPIVRIYSWETPTISLGKLQKRDILNLDTIENDKIEIVSRPTGGRAVFHSNDITYSYMLPKSENFIKSFELYEKISIKLQQALSVLGIESHKSKNILSGEQIRSEQKLPCFLSKSKNEITVDGKKIIGSAQVLLKDGFIQHGSIPLDMSFAKLPFYMNESKDIQKFEYQELLRSATCLNNFSFDDVAEALISSFSKVV